MNPLENLSSPIVTADPLPGFEILVIQAHRIPLHNFLIDNETFRSD